MSKTPARYRLDFPRLIWLALPIPMRKPRFLGWFTALTSGVADLYKQFLDYRLNTLQELSYNGQTALLEKALNDKLDSALRRVVIRNSTVYLDPLYINYERENQVITYSHQEREGQPALYPHRESDFASQVGFTVYAPGLNAKDYKLNVLIRRFKLALVSYRILYIQAPPL